MLLLEDELEPVFLAGPLLALVGVAGLVIPSCLLQSPCLVETQEEALLQSLLSIKS